MSTLLFILIILLLQVKAMMETGINGQIQIQNLWDGAPLIDIMRKQAIEYDFNKGRMVINSILLADKTEINNRSFFY